MSLFETIAEITKPVALANKRSMKDAIIIAPNGVDLYCVDYREINGSIEITSVSFCEGHKSEFIPIKTIDNGLINYLTNQINQPCHF